jgi:hypothetical protein
MPIGPHDQEYISIYKNILFSQSGQNIQQTLHLTEDSKFYKYILSFQSFRSLQYRL